MPSPAEADAMKDPVNQVADWDSVKADIEGQFAQNPPPIALRYHAFFSLTDFTLTLLRADPDFVACRYYCDAHSNRIEHIHSGEKTYSITADEAAEYARRTLRRIETFFESTAGGSAAGIKWNVKGQLKTKDEVVEEMKSSIRITSSSQSKFVLKDPQDCAPRCGETKRYFGAFTNVTFHGTIEIRRYFAYDSATGTISWKPGFTVIPSGDVSINVDSTVDWLPPEFNWTKTEGCDPCSHASLYKETFDGEFYAINIYDHADPAAKTVGDPPIDTGSVAAITPVSDVAFGPVSGIDPAS